MIGSYYASQGIHIKLTFPKDDESRSLDVQHALVLLRKRGYNVQSPCSVVGRVFFSHCLVSVLTRLSRHTNWLFKMGHAENRGGGMFQDGQTYCRRFFWLFISTTSMVQNCKMSNTCFDGIKCEIGKGSMS